MIEIRQHKSIYEYVLPDTIESVVAVGDIHGEFSQFIYTMCKQKELRNTACIVCGDCGFGFNKYGYYEDIIKRKKFNKLLEKLNDYIIFIRGNHDSPEYFKTPDSFRHDRFLCVPDYSVIEHFKSGHSILCVGGGISIDRKWRINAEEREPDKYAHNIDKMHPGLYWSDEDVVFDEQKIQHASEIAVIDTVLSHQAPSFMCPTDDIHIKSWSSEDDKLIEDNNRNIENLDKVLDCLIENGNIVSKWFCGHYHFSKVEYVSDIRCQILGIMEFSEIR